VEVQLAKERNLKIEIKRNYIGLYFAPFLVDMLMGSITIAVPLLAISLGVSSFWLGILGSSPGLTYVSLCFLFGKLSEKWHRKNLLVLGLFVYAAASLLLSFSSRIYHLYLSMLLLGIAGAMFWPSLEAWIAEKESKRTLMQKMALFNISWSTGFAMGPLIGGILFGMNFKLPFYFAFIVSIFVLLILFYKTPKISFATKSKSFTDKTFISEDPPDSFSLYIKISRMANFILCLCMGMIRYIFPKLATQLQISSSSLGLLMFIISLSQMFTFYGLGRVHQWHYRIFPLVLFQLIATVGLLIIFTTSSLSLFFLAFVLVGMGLGMTYSSSLFYSINVISQKGPSAAIHETVLMSGFLLGPLIGGVVAQEFSLRAPYLAVAAIVVVGILIQILIKRHYGFLNKTATQQRT